MLEMLKIYLELAIDGEGEPGGSEPTPETTEPTDTTVTTDNEPTDASLDNTPTEQFFDVDGEKLTLQQIKEYKQGFLRQSDYTRKTQEIANQRAQYKEAVELYEYFKANPHLAEKLAELDADASKITANSSIKVDPAIQDMQIQLKTMEINSKINEIKAQDPNFNEIEVLQMAMDNKIDVDKAYKMWRGENFDKILKDKLAKQSSELTETIKKANTNTKTLIKPGDASPATSNYGLASAEMLIADKLGMTYEEYSKWK